MSHYDAFTIRYAYPVSMLHSDVVIIKSPISPESESLINTDVFGAIWDTGATGSVITNSVVEKLSLKPIGKRKVKGVHEVKIVDVFYINIVLPNRVLIRNIPVTSCQELSEGVGVLIGMDVIGMGDFCVTRNNDNGTTMSYGHL